MENKAWLRLIGVMLVLPLAVACNRADEETQADIEVETTPAPPAAPVMVTIVPQGGSMVAGELSATHEMDKTIVRLSLSSLTDGKDYEARIRYGDCTIAASYINDDLMGADAPAATATPEATAPATTADAHDPGEVVASINLDRTGVTATGTAEIENDELRADEAAYLVITEDSDADVLVGCVDLRGHGGMGATAPAPAAEPGAAMPADSAHR